MPITIKARSPASEIELKHTEAEIGVSIPAGYRAFLLAANGGRPVERMFSDRVIVNDFLGVQDIAEAWRSLRRRLPETLLPIAIDSFGNYVCISTGASDSGAIHFWDHEHEHPEEEAVERLTSSFDEFVARLHAPPAEPLPPHRVVSADVDPEFLAWAREQAREIDERPALFWPRGDRTTD